LPRSKNNNKKKTLKFNTMKQFAIIFLAMLLFSTCAIAQERIVNQLQFDDDIILNPDQIMEVIKQHKNSETKSVTSEDFEGDIFPPYGWSVINGGDDSTFIHFQRGVRTGTGCAMIWRTEYAHDDYLITPQLTIAAGSSILSAWFLNHMDPFPETYDVMVSTTGNAANDFVMFQAGVVPESIYTEKSYDFSDYIGQNIYVAFRSTTTNQYALYIDDVSLPPVLFPYENDLAVIEILPRSVEYESFIPEVITVNYGNAEETYYTVTLTDGLFYNESIEISASLASGDEVVVEFPEYTAEEQGTTIFTTTVTVAGDENSGNNTYSQEVYIYDPIFQQYPFVNGVGIHATGADVSMLESTQTGLGKGFNHNQQFHLADDFIIPAEQTWTINGFRFFGYQTGSTLLSTLYGAYIKIYSGDPDQGGYVIADYGDENLLVSSSFSNAYREETGDITTTDRPIMEIVCEIPELILETGEYWVSVGAMGSIGTPNAPQIGPYMVHLQLPNGNTTTGNAIRFFMGSVMEWTDDGPQGMPFDVFGMAEGVGVSVDENNNIENNVQAFPNPSSGLFELNITGQYDVIVSDISGRIIATSKITPGNSKIDLTSQNPGIYFLSILGDENFNLKVVVK
jgi:Cleaved Adhesin Domain/Secretion system C-terminal sorting domain